MGNVAVVADSNPSMGTMLPGSILRIHYMTIDASFGIIGKV